MAIVNNPNMFNLGAVELDSTPSVNLYAQLAAKDRAKNDAFDEYIRGLNTKITPAGVRTADLDAFNDRKNKWTEYGMRNKDKLLKGDIEANSEFNRLYQETVNIPIESKAAEEQKKPFVEMITDPNKRSRLSSNVFDAVKVHDEPLYVKDPKTGEFVRNYNRKPIDYTGKIFNPDFDFNKGYEGWAKDMDRSETPGDVVSRDKITGRANVAFTKAYTPEQIKQISQNAARSAEKGGENNDYYQLRYEQIYKDPVKAKELNDAFQSVYGKEIKLLNGQTIPNYIDSPEEVAAAEAILQAKAMTEKGVKPASDYDLRQNDKIQTIILRDNLSDGNRGGGSGGGGTTISGNEFDRLPKPKTGLWSGRKTLSPDQIPAQTQAILKSGGIDIEGAVSFDVEEKDGVIQSITPYYNYGTSDKPSIKKDKTIYRSDMENAQLKYNAEPQKGNQPSFGDNSNQQPRQSSVPTYKRSDLLKSGWTEAQIKEATKRGKIKVN